MIIVTGATGKLGTHVVEQLLATQPAHRIAVAVRNPNKAAALAARGVEVRRADYADPRSVEAALRGAEKVLLISSSEVGQRAAQHEAVVRAAKQAGVRLLAYTSILHADTSKLSLAREHLETEHLIRAAEIPFAILRNGWYTENYTEQLPVALQHGVFIGSAGQGKIAAATRADYAAAAVAVLTSEAPARNVYELAGDRAFTMQELAAEISRQVGRTIGYIDMPQSEYEQALIGAGLPAPFAAVLADADVGVARGELDDSSGDLQRLIGRASTPLSAAVAVGLAAHASRSAA
jgi:NAD(P)H dehydrogenase (quinone)